MIKPGLVPAALQGLSFKYEIRTIELRFHKKWIHFPFDLHRFIFDQYE